MNERSNRIDWLVFFALGFMWGSSYLFIKLAVDDFGTFTLVALRLLVGALLLWTVVRIAKQPLPRERRIYGHLLVMAVVNITIPFLLITWAEQSVESSLAAILTSPVPLFAIVLVGDLPGRRADPGQRHHRAHRRVHRRDHHHQPGPDRGRIVGHRRAGPPRRRRSATPAAPSTRDATCAASRPMIPAVFQVSFAAIITGVIALLFEHPWTATPDAEAIVLDPVARASSGRVSPTSPCSACSSTGARPGRRSSPTSSRSSGSSSAISSCPSPSTHGSSSGRRWSSPASAWSTAGSGDGGSSGAVPPVEAA